MIYKMKNKALFSQNFTSNFQEICAEYQKSEKCDFWLEFISCYYYNTPKYNQGFIAGVKLWQGKGQ